MTCHSTSGEAIVQQVSNEKKFDIELHLKMAGQSSNTTGSTIQQAPKVQRPIYAAEKQKVKVRELYRTSIERDTGTKLKGEARIAYKSLGISIVSGWPEGIPFHWTATRLFTKDICQKILNNGHLLKFAYTGMTTSF